MSPRTRTDQTLRLPPGLAGPIDLELARAVDAIPGETALPGGSRYEPKWDGFRFGIVRSEDDARLWSRQGKDLTDRFPDIAAAAVRYVPAGVVLDGEVVILLDGKLSFDALQRRLVTSPSKARKLVADAPASYVAFDVLATAGVDLRTQRWTVRRGRLEKLASNWASTPLQLSPVTDSLAEAQEWFDVLPDAMGIEGLVVKGAATRYTGGQRGWVKVKRRASYDVLAGGVLGPINRPEVVIAGRYTADGELVMVGRTVPLTAAQSAELGAVLRPGGSRHPWPDEITSYRWGGKDSKKPLTKVRPETVIEVAADAAVQAGQWRHGLRYLRLRAELGPEDVPTLDSAAGN
jgi:ATP-dependent DNA ligase